MWKNADVPLIIEPSATEHYYTTELDMWKNADVPRADVPPH